jgi:hypothetical protein
MLLEKSGTLAAHPLSTLHWPIRVRTPDGKIRGSCVHDWEKATVQFARFIPCAHRPGRFMPYRGLPSLGLGLKF